MQFAECPPASLPAYLQTMEADLASMWEGLTKPEQYKACNINDFFDVRGGVEGAG